MSIANQSGIYAITNAKSGGMYVGSAVNFKRRWRKHLSDLRRGGHHSQVLQNAWNKHGADAFVFDVIEFVDPPRLIEREQVWLNFFKPQCNVAKIAGAVMAGRKHSRETKERMASAHLGRTLSAEHRSRISVGKKGVLRSPETRAKMSAAVKGRSLSPEWRAKISAALKGRPTGRTCSLETREKLRVASSGHTPSPETREKLRVASSGHTPTRETRARMSLAQIGRKHTPETRAKISAAAAIREQNRSARLLTGDGAPSQNQSHAEYRHRDGAPAPAGYEAERGE